MDTVKKKIAGKYMLLFFTVTYLFVAIMHIFFLPHYNVDNTRAPRVSNSIFKRHSVDKEHQDGIMIDRTDKSTLEEKRKAVTDIVQLAAVAFILIFAAFIVRKSDQQTIPYRNLANNRQYSYLSFCTFRI